jgi:hypothetical protein
MVLTSSLESNNITNSYEISIPFTSKIFKSDMSSIHFGDLDSLKNTCAKYFT